MKTRDNVEVRVTVEVLHTKSMYETQKLAAAQRSTSGAMEIKDMAAHVKALIQEAKTQVIAGLDALNDKDEAEDEKKSA